MNNKQLQQEKSRGLVSLLENKRQEQQLELYTLMREKIELNDIEDYLIQKSCQNIFDDTVKPALFEVRTSKTYNRIRSNYLSGVLTCNYNVEDLNEVYDRRRIRIYKLEFYK